MSDPRIPSFLRRLWARVALVIVVGTWAVVELVVGNTIWGVMFAAAAVWALWDLILRPLQSPKA